MAGANTKEIKRRIKSIESTKQITKAMELVATSKLRRAKERVEATRPYFDILSETISEIGGMNTEFDSVYTQKRETKNSLYIVIAGDRGLAGGYNGNIFRFTAQELEGKSVTIIPIGKKSCEYYSKRGYTILEQFENVGEYISFEDAADISKIALEAYKSGKVDEIRVVYTDFISSLEQQVKVTQVLPFTGNKTEDNTPKELVLYEPSAGEVFDAIIPDYVAGFLLGAIIKSFTSEQAARRTAMESANDNATQMIDDLVLSFNRARQGAITQELTEIVSGANASK